MYKGQRSDGGVLRVVGIHKTKENAHPWQKTNTLGVRNSVFFHVTREKGMDRKVKR